MTMRYGFLMTLFGFLVPVDKSRRIVVALLGSLALIGGGVATLGLAACNGDVTDGLQPSPTPHPLSASPTIEIVSDFPVSGDDRTLGLPLQEAFQMAIT